APRVFVAERGRRLARLPRQDGAGRFPRADRAAGVVRAPVAERWPSARGNEAGLARVAAELPAQLRIARPTAVETGRPRMSTHPRAVDETHPPAQGGCSDA